MHHDAVLFQTDIPFMPPTCTVHLCRCPQRAQRAHEIRLDPVHRRFTAVIVDKYTVPDFQREHYPDSLLAVDATFDMVVHYAANHVSVVVAAVKASIGKQYIGDQAAPRSASPFRSVAGSR